MVPEAAETQVTSLVRSFDVELRRRDNPTLAELNVLDDGEQDLACPGTEGDGEWVNIRKGHHD